LFSVLIGLPISEVEFPSVVICSQGFDLHAITAATYAHILSLSNTTTYEQFGLSPFRSAELTFKAVLGVCL